MNSLPLSQSIPSKGKGKRNCIALSALETAIYVLFGMARHSVHPVATSTAVSV
jgi:hypothetical protein